MRIALILALGIAASGYAPESAGRPPRPVFTTQYRPDGNLIMLPLRVGNRVEWFMFDASAGHFVVDPRLTDRLGLHPTGAGSTTGSGKGSVAVQHVEPFPLKFGPVALEPRDPWVVDLSRVPISQDVRGLIGSDLWKRYVIRIDPIRHRFTLYEPRTYRAPKGAPWIPLIVEGERLYLEAILDIRSGFSVKHKLRIDTAAEESVNDPILAQAVQVQRTRLGRGLGEDYIASSGKMDAVHIGPYTIRSVWGPASEGPGIGMEIFRRFVTTFDASRGRLYLTPTPALSEPVPPPPRD